MSRKAKFDHTGSSFDDFLEAEGIREEVEAAAIKAVIAADLPGAHATPSFGLEWGFSFVRPACRCCNRKTPLKLRLNGAPDRKII